MRAYVGQTRSHELVAELTNAGIGECTSRGEFPPRRSFSWFYDNGAYADFKACRSFGIAKFWRELAHLFDCVQLGEIAPPDFIVLPDIVAGGAASLDESLSWLPIVRTYAAAGLTFYVAVQNGMTEGDVDAFLARAGAAVSGLFVGGDLAWKLETGASWARFAHARGLRCHIGRVGTVSRVRWAREAGADSIDSALPLWSRRKLQSFIEAVGADAGTSAPHDHAA